MTFAFVIFGLLSCNESSKNAALPTHQLDKFQIQRDIDSVKYLVTQSFEDIWSDLDTEKIEEHHTRDFMLLENGVVWNNDSVANYLGKERKAMEIGQYQRLNHFEWLKAEHHKHSVWVAYHNYGTWMRKTDTLGSAHWLESAIAIKDQGQWKLQQLHSTAVRK